MTERFTIIGGIVTPIRTGIYDNKKLTSDGFGGELDIYDVVDLLNRHETELQQVNDFYSDRIIELINEKEELKK